MACLISSKSEMNTKGSYQGSVSSTRSSGLQSMDFSNSSMMLVVDKDVQFAGIINNISVALDPTSRTEVLQAVDQGKKDKKIPYVSKYVKDSLLSLDTYSIKVVSKIDKELKLRVPIHEAAALSYIYEDNLHMLALKYGDVDFKNQTLSAKEMSCCIAIMYCDSRETADFLCASVDDCFHSLNAKVIMNEFDNIVAEGAKTPAADPPFRNRHMHHDSTGSEDFGFMTQSLSNIPSTVSSTSEFVQIKQPAKTDETLSDAANQLIIDYMKKLFNKLNPEELEKFALLFKAWHTDLPFPNFCQSVLELYGPNRKYLLIGMKPFIPAKDFDYFESFLERNGLTDSNKLDSFRSGDFGSSCGSLNSIANSCDDMLDRMDRISNGEDGGFTMIPSSRDRDLSYVDGENFQ